MNALLVVLSLSISVVLALDYTRLVGQARCADFNHGVTHGALAELHHAFVCPADDGIAGKYCTDKFPMRSARDVMQSNLNSKDVIFFILIGPNSGVDPLIWWLQLVKESIDLVFVADACSGGATECQDSATSVAERITKEHPLVHTHVVRSLPSDSGYKILSCKLRTGQKLIYEMFPTRKYFFKIDTDTIVFPHRLMNFLNTLESIAENGHNTPLYFGTMVESGIPQLLCKHSTVGSSWEFQEANASLCYCQGGAGYGLSNVVMKHLAGVPSCANSAPSDLPEDLYTALEVYNTFNHTVGIHCGGFRSSELVGDEWFRKSISFHYIDTKWLQSHGQKLIAHYQNHVN